jgi:putative nucleotidyltransferase with HDIG domain
MIERDAELSARVLQLARAPLFGDPPVASIADAVAHLGIEMVVGLALASYAFALAGDRPPPALAIAELQRHSLQVARAARRLATSPEVATDAFIAGLVHDIGKVVIATVFPEAHAEIVSRHGPGDAPSGIEREVLGVSHAEIGAYLLGRWGLPLPVLDAIAHHNDDITPMTPVLAVMRAAHVATSSGRE